MNMLIQIIAIIFIFSGCTRNNKCFNTTGNIVTEIHHLDTAIQSIAVYDDINLELAQTFSPYILIKGGENLLQNIEHKRKNDKLELKNSNACKYLRSYEFEICAILNQNIMPEYVIFNSSARLIASDTIKRDVFNFWVEEGRGEVNIKINVNRFNLNHSWGYADIKISGQANLGDFFIVGGSRLDLKDLEIKKAIISAYGVNNTYIQVSDTLNIKISGIGDVYCYGNPYIENYEKYGEGQLIMERLK